MPVAHHKPQYRYRLWLIPSGRWSLGFWATTKLVTTPLRWFILISFISLDHTWIVLPYNSSSSFSTTFSTYALKAKHLVVVWQVSLFSPCREDNPSTFHFLRTSWALRLCPCGVDSFPFQWQLPDESLSSLLQHCPSFKERIFKLYPRWTFRAHHYAQHCVYTSCGCRVVIKFSFTKFVSASWDKDAASKTAAVINTGRWR